jgi:hypothetical protein
MRFLVPRTNIWVRVVTLAALVGVTSNAIVPSNVWATPQPAMTTDRGLSVELPTRNHNNQCDRVPRGCGKGGSR